MADDTLRLKLGKGAINVPWSRLDRAIQAVAPRWAASRLQARVGHEMVAQMGGYNGASNARRSLTGWNPLGGDADTDTLRDLPSLRNRSSDLVRNSPVAGGAINTNVTHVVGTGLALQCTIDAPLLGLDDEAADAWQQDTERKFAAWFESTDCDITRHQTGYGLQALTLRAECERGDVLVLLVKAAWARGAIKLAIQVVEGDRLSNPDKAPDADGLVAGVQMDDNGAPTTYHIANANPYRRSGAAAQRKLTWTPVPAFGARTGRRNVLHIFERRRPGQTRGVPMLAAVIEPLKQLERYTEAELMAAVVSGMFTVFITTENNAGAALAPSAMGGGASAVAGGWDGKLGNGLAVDLGKGEKIETANPGRPNAQFDPFVNAIIRQIGLVLEIPYEVLIKHYSSSYSASRAALLDAWRVFRTRRDRLAQQFCAPIYEAWMDEAVATGYIVAPGYFADPLIRRAWLGAMWIGDGPGSIDPVKEVDAAERRVQLGISTHEAESLLHDGGKLRPKIRQLLREQELMKGLVKIIRPGAPAPVPGAADTAGQTTEED